MCPGLHKRTLPANPAGAVSELTDEAVLVGSLKHDNVVKVLGVINAGSSSMMVLFEFCGNGSLEDILETAAEEDKTVADLGIYRLTSFLVDVAAAMEYLGEIKCVHRDLATRNVLVTAEDVAKVADFGLGRQLEADEVYDAVTARPLPARWMVSLSFVADIVVYLSCENSLLTVCIFLPCRRPKPFETRSTTAALTSGHTESSSGKRCPSQSCHTTRYDCVSPFPPNRYRHCE